MINGDDFVFLSFLFYSKQLTYLKVHIVGHYSQKRRRGLIREHRNGSGPNHGRSPLSKLKLNSINLKYLSGGSGCL